MPESLERNAKEFYEFGPFRVDPEKETLVREGEPVPLTPKTFQILLALVRHHQEVVTKDDLMKMVWPDTFVEEANLSRNIFMLRKALGESAQDHRYIVTVPGRGYRLAESVHMVPEQELTVVAASHTRVQIEVSERAWWKWASGAAILALVAAAFVWWFAIQRHPVLGEADTIVLADFANSTGDPVFDGALRQGLAVELEQSSFLSLVSEDRIRRTLPLMGLPGDTRLTPEVSRQICERIASRAVLEGSIARIGVQYLLSLHARNCRTGDSLDDEQVQFAQKEDVLNALSRIATRFRRRMGESRSAIEIHEKPLAEATTSSLEALKAYSAASDTFLRNGPTVAVPLFRRAIELDPQFAMAHASLGRMYADLDQSDLAAASIATAWRLRERTSDREGFYITAAYQSLTAGNQEQARLTCETWARAYPRDAVPHSLLGGFINRVAGRFTSAAAEARKAIEIDSDLAIAHYNFAVDRAYDNRLDEAGSILRQAEARGLEIDEFSMLEFDMAFLKNDNAGMERVAARARERTAAEGWVTNKEAYAAAFAGRLQRARSLSRLAAEQSVHVSQPERAALWQAAAAIREALFLNEAEARKQALSALTLSTNREVEYGAAFALALSSDLGRAQALAGDLQNRFPEDTLVRFSYLPTLRALFALNRHSASEAVDMLQIAAPYEFGTQHYLIGSLYPVYVRGLAYLADHRGAEAAVEFQKILDHRPIVVSDPIGVFAQLQLGRALALAGDKKNAALAYEKLFAVWRDADAGLPILKQAKGEYSALIAGDSKDQATAAKP